MTFMAWLPDSAPPSCSHRHFPLVEGRSIIHRSERRSVILARNKRDLVAATEIPAISAISLIEPSCTCWISNDAAEGWPQTLYRTLQTLFAFFPQVVFFSICLSV